MNLTIHAVKAYSSEFIVLSLPKPHSVKNHTPIFFSFNKRFGSFVTTYNILQNLTNCILSIGLYRALQMPVYASCIACRQIPFILYLSILVYTALVYLCWEVRSFEIWTGKLFLWTRCKWRLPWVSNSQLQYSWGSNGGIHCSATKNCSS